MFFLFLDLKYKTELQQIIFDSLTICNKPGNPIFSFWQFVLLFFFLVLIYFQPPPLSSYINEDYIIAIICVIILIFKTVLVYNLVTKSIEQNCVHGFRQQMKTLFYD